MSRLGPTGLTQLLTDIKTWVTTKLGNYVTTNTTQTITGKKLFTNSAIQLDSIVSMSGSTMFIDTSAAAPRGEFPAEAHRVGRIYIGDNTSYNGAWFIVDPIIDTNRAYYRMVTTNPDNTDSARFSICWDSRYEGVHRRRNISMGDLLPSGASTYNLGESGNAWQDAYINKIHGISDYTNLKTNTFNVNTTLTHGGSGRRVILAMGAITLTVPAPEEGSWFLIKAVNGLVTLNLASNVTVTGITAGVFSGPIYLQPNESILLCYYSSTTYNATISTIRRSGVVGRTGNVPSENPKHWFKIAENYVTATYRDPFICLRVFESTTGNTIGTLCAHCRVNNTVGVVDTSNCYLQWQDAGSSNDLSKYALTTNETSGTGVTITLWCMLIGGWSSLKFEVVTEYGAVDQLGNPEWVLTRRRQADGDLAELLDTDFTKIVYSTLTTLKNDTTGKASNVTGTVAIANGGTGATTRLNAVKNLTNEAVSSPTHFLAITTNWGKAGYTNISQVKTVLGITGDMGSHSDSEYVHKTGDETISGDKTFANSKVIVGRNTDVGSAIQLINSDVVGDSANGSSGFEVYGSSISDDNKIGGLTVGEYSNNGGAYATIEVNRTVSGVKTTTAIRSLIRSDGSKEFSPSTDNDIKLGHSSFRWSAIYGNTYYYGSNNVEFSTKFVTTDTDQSISGSKIFNGDKIVITQGNGYRMVCNADGGASGYGVFQRVDSVNWYLMVTAQNDALGSWTSARPASMNLSTGVLSINGNAATATQFSANKDVTLTGDVTGTASSKAGWSVATTLANSGVTAGTYGPSEDVTGNNNATISVPEITVDAKGRVTSVTNRTLTCKNNTYNVYNKTLTIQKNGTNVATFTSNSNTDVTANITVPTKVSELTNDSGYLTSHQSLSNYVTLNTAQEITNTKTFKDANTVVKRTDIEAGNTLPSADKLARNIFQDKNGKELGSIFYYKNTSGNTGLCLRAGDWFSESEGVYSLNASGTNRRAELYLYSDSSGNCCIKPVGYFSATLKALSTSVWLGESTKPFGRVYANAFEFCNAGLLPDTDVQTTEEHSIGFFGQKNTPLSYITFQKRPNLKDRVAIRIQTASSSYKSYDFDATCFYPESSNSVDIGSTTNIFKNIYCNNYYKGTTAFGDIVTHNASEFLTSHQSLSSCVKNVVTNNQTIKSTGITRGTAPSSTQTFGIGFSDNNNKYIGNVYGQYATDKSTYVGLYAYKGSTTTNGDNVSVRVGYDASGNAYTYAPTPATADNSTQIATTAFVKAQGYLTAHQSLANYVTTNTDQSISGIKSHSKHISILGDYVGNESSTNGRSCLYLKANRDTDGKSGLYVTKFRQNVAQGSMGNSDVVFLSHDILENETRTNAGFVESYSNWEDDVPKGISVYSTIATRNLGTSAKPWTNTYAVNFYENGTALSSKYALNENFGKGTTTYLYINAADFPTGSGPSASIQYNDAVDGTKLYVWLGVCGSSSILSINLTAAQVTGSTGQVWRYLGPTIYAGGLGPTAASPTGILGLFRRES